MPEEIGPPLKLSTQLGLFSGHIFFGTFALIILGLPAVSLSMLANYLHSAPGAEFIVLMLVGLPDCVFLHVKANLMKSSTGTFALRLAAIAVLSAPTIVQAQGTGQTVCRDVWVPGRFNGWGPNEQAHNERVCNSVYYPPPAPPPAEPPVQHTTGSETTVEYNAPAAARKAQMRDTEHRASSGSNLCPPPYRMTAQDGCQK
jgi:hypothetical protein